MTLFFCALTTIAIVHAVALEQYLYWKYFWFDIPMHLFGGITCALGYSILPFLRITIKERYQTVLWYILFTVSIGILWEVFEVVTHISIVEPGFIQDTLTDLLMDMLGAGIGYGIVQSSKSLE